MEFEWEQQRRPGSRIHDIDNHKVTTYANFEQVPVPVRFRSVFELHVNDFPRVNRDITRRTLLNVYRGISTK